MKHPDPIRDATRRQERERRLGPDAMCNRCGERSLECLTRAPTNLLEVHHVVGKANDPHFTEVLCRNCHAKRTEGLECAGVSMQEPADVLERLVMIGRAIAAFLVDLAQRLLEWMENVAQLREFLDERYPEWRGAFASYRREIHA